MIEFFSNEVEHNPKKCVRKFFIGKLKKSLSF